MRRDLKLKLKIEIEIVKLCTKMCYVETMYIKCANPKIICCKTYFMFSIFVVYANYKSIFTMRSTVYCNYCNTTCNPIFEFQEFIFYTSQAFTLFMLIQFTDCSQPLLCGLPIRLTNRCCHSLTRSVHNSRKNSYTLI